MAVIVRANRSQRRIQAVRRPLLDPPGFWTNSHSAVPLSPRQTVTSCFYRDILLAINSKVILFFFPFSSNQSCVFWRAVHQAIVHLLVSLCKQACWCLTNPDQSTAGPGPRGSHRLAQGWPVTGHRTDRCREYQS